MHRHAARVRGRAEFVEIGLVVEPHAFVEREPAAGGGAVEQTSESTAPATSSKRSGSDGIAPISQQLAAVGAQTVLRRDVELKFSLP